MADSLVIANSIELLGGGGGEYSTLPNLEQTIFALNDQADTYSLGEPQPTVDILASLITDGERPQGRRASNRTLSIPVAIISDTRDNLALARETLFELVDQQRWTLTFARDNSGTGPMILDCWRAEPATVGYSVTEEEQFVSEVVLNFQALPYGRSDTPNQITFLAPASGSSPPPSPIVLDSFSVIPPGQSSIWNTATAAVQGNSSAFCPSPRVNPQITNPLYVNNSIGTQDLTSGTGVPALNVIQFWAGFASPQFFSYWANHQSEVRFIVTLTDINGNTIANSRQYLVSESNSYAHPKWYSIQVRLPTVNENFDWTQVTGFSIKVQNFHDAQLHGSNVFLDICSAVAPSAASANTVRGSVYKLNGIEGSVHTPVSIIAQQQPATSPTVVTLTPSSGTFIGPAGVTQSVIEAIGPGGNGGQITTPTAYAGGGGGGEYSRENVGLITPGKVYAPFIPSGLASQAGGAFSAWTQCGVYNTAGVISSPTFNVTAAVAAQNCIIITIAVPPGGTLPTSVSDSASASNKYRILASSTGPDGTLLQAWGMFQAVALTTSNTFTLTGLTSTAGVEVVCYTASGLYSDGQPPAWSGSGTDAKPAAWVKGFINGDYDANAGIQDWTVSGTTPSLVVNSSPPSGSPRPSTLALSSTTAADTPTMESGMVPVIGGVTTVKPRMIGFLATQATMTVNLITQWYDATQTAVSSNTDAVTMTASTWQAQMGTGHTAPSNAAYVTCKAQIASAVSGNALQLTALGLIKIQSLFPSQVAVIANNGGQAGTATATPGWTHLYGTTAETPLSMDIFTSAGAASGRGGDLAATTYTASTPWAALSFTVSRMAGQTIFTADDIAVIANGGNGQPVATSSASVGGTFSENSVHNDGAAGAAGVSTNGGGGGSSGGSGGAATWVDDTAGNFAYSVASAPPILISSGIPPSRAKYVQGSVNTFGSEITDTGASASDLILVCQVNAASGNPSVYLGDTQGNTYTYITGFPLANGYRANVFYAHSTNQPSGTLKALSVGDNVFAKSTSVAGNYYLFTYAMHGVTGPTTVTSGGTSTLTKTYNPTASKSWYGSDGSNPNATRSSNGTIYQGNAQDGYNGTQKCAWIYNKAAIQSDFSGYSCTSCSIAITNEHTWYNAGMTLRFNEWNSSSLPSSWNGAGAPFIETDHINEGARSTFALSTAVGDDFIAGSTYGLALAGVSSTDLNYYGYLNGANSSAGPVLTITGQLSTTSTSTNGVATADHTGTSFTLTDSNFSASNVAHVVFALAQDSISSKMTPRQNPTVDTELFTSEGSDGFTASTILQAFWKDADSTTSTNFAFTRPTSGDVAYEATSWIMETSGWTAGTNAAYHNGTSHYSNKAGKKIVITFSGTQAQVMGLKAPNHGIMLVSVDSAPYVSVDTYSSILQYQTVLYDTGLLGSGTHTITILTTGQQSSASTGTYIDIDGYQLLTAGAGLPGSGVTGGAAPAGGGAGGNGGATSANGAAGSTPGGGGGGASSTSGTHTGGKGGDGQVQLTYFSNLPAFKTLVLHRPSLDGSKTLLPYIACSSQAVPTNDQVTGMDAGVIPHFKGTYSFVIAASSFNTPANARTITVTVNEYERLGGSVTATQSVSKSVTPNSADPTTGAPNNIVTIGELTLPIKDIPPDNNNAVYFVTVNSSNSADLIQDVMMLDTMGQTLIINDPTAYAQYFIDEPQPDTDIGRILGSQFDRDYSISVLDFAYPSGGPLTVEPGDNVLFAYCYEGAPALIASYFPRYFIDRTVS